MKNHSLRLILLACFVSTAMNAVSQSLYKEKYRPQYHFSPAINWTNDPNGLVYNKGTYHIFYQYNPMGIRWGHMSWGHAISKDLVSWEHLPVAIEEGKDVMIFSGSCVVDEENTSGFGKDGKVPMVAIYTGHKHDGSHQSQHIAYSLDDGITWKKYEKNPVLDINKKDFRDPKVFWYEKQSKWVMAVCLPNEKQIQFYSSPDLKDWKMMSVFGPGGDTTGIWECPDLFEVPVVDQPGKTKWVLMHSPAPYMQYFVGDFDGTTFTAENDINKIYRPDYGPDYYAAIAFNNVPKGTAPISIGWANNWNYAEDIPTMPWRSAMSLARKIYVKKIGNEWRMIQKPVEALSRLRRENVHLQTKAVANQTITIPVTGQQLELACVLDIGDANDVGVSLAAGAGNEIRIGYNRGSKKLYIDRAKTSNSDFHPNFKKLSRYEESLLLQNNLLQLHIFFDNSLVEVFANNGELVMTAQIFPLPGDNKIQVFSNGKSMIKNLDVWKLKSAW